MAVERINETDTLNQGRIKINAILDQANASSEKVEGYDADLKKGIEEAKKIATDAGAEAVQIATDATAEIEATANQANANSQTAINTANNAVSTANQNKQEFDQLRNDFDDLVAEAGDSNPEIVQARTDTTGIKQTTLANRLTVDFGDRMTKADGIELFSGQTNVKKMMDFSGKTAGNTATNPHQAYSDFTAKALKKPSDTWNEVAQTDYNKLAARDDSGVSTGSSASGVIPQQLYKLNTVEAVKSLAPQLFDGLDVSQSVQFVKNNFVSLVLSIRGKASSPNNKNLKVSTYLESTDSWTTQIQGDATEYTDFTVQINDANFIGSDGFVYAVAYSDMTNGVTASNVDIDYIGVAVEVSINAQDVLVKGGFAKESYVNEAVAEVTKESLGLGNVQNYGVATQSEAQAGASDQKYMTPLKVNQLIKSMMLDLTYPVGSIYQSNQNIDPAELFGGTWDRYGNGKVAVGVDEADTDFLTVEKTGGSKKHNHGSGSIATLMQLSGTTLAVKGGTTTPWKSSVKLNSAAASTDTAERTASVLTQGDTGESSTLQPYITVYRWVRIS